jgi:Flp pilus assembly protein TadD
MSLGFSNAGVHRNRAVMHSQLQQFPQAIAELRKAIALEPKSAELKKYLGIMLFNSGETVAARKELEESLRLNPADAQTAELLRQAAPKPGP